MRWKQGITSTRSAIVVTSVIIIAPESAPQIAAPKPPLPPAPPKLDWLEQRILNLVRECEPLKLWQALNLLAEEMSPRNRDEDREVRLSLLRKVERLIRFGLLFRGRWNRIATYKFMAKAGARQVGRRKPTVAKTTSTKPVSAIIPPSPPKQECEPIPFCTQVVAASPVGQQSTWTEAKTESDPERDQITRAAMTLARLPRHQKRTPTGWLRGEHCWRGRFLVLPDGEVAPLLWCNRGSVLLVNYKKMELPDYLCWARRRESDVRFFKCREAVLLGSRKAGVKERPSTRKQEAARRNGCMPPREGRSRGRPKKFTLPQTLF